jgi:hypothetical protein
MAYSIILRIRLPPGKNTVPTRVTIPLKMAKAQSLYYLEHAASSLAHPENIAKLHEVIPISSQVAPAFNSQVENPRSLHELTLSKPGPQGSAAN